MERAKLLPKKQWNHDRFKNLNCHSFTEFGVSGFGFRDFVFRGPNP
jgi:hypothetical protein